MFSSEALDRTRSTLTLWEQNLSFMAFGALLSCDGLSPTLLGLAPFIYSLHYMALQGVSMIWVYVMGARVYMRIHSVPPD